MPEFLVERSRLFVADLAISHGSAPGVVHNTPGEDVAEAVFVAATDGTDRLRYVVTDDIKELVRLRHEASEEQYMAFVREYIGPQA